MSLANDTSYVPDKLPFSTFSFAGDERSIQFVANSRRFSCDIARYDCSVADTLPSGLPYVKSPDGRWEAFSHEYNPCYVRAVARQDERNVEHMHYESAFLESGPPLSAVATTCYTPSLNPRAVAFLCSCTGK